MYIYIFIYIYIIPGIKVGILATGCRRYWTKNNAKRQQNCVKLPKSTRNQRENLPYRQVQFFGCCRYRNIFPGIIYMYICVYILLTHIGL